MVAKGQGVMSHVTGDKALINKADSRPIQLLKSGQLLAIAADCQGGLILQKPFYAEFVGPGAAVGGTFDIQSTSAYVLGKVQFLELTTYAERQQAFQKRIAYIKKFQETILPEQSPLRRACLIMNQLYQWFGVDETKRIPNELMAQLVGVLPGTIAIAQQQSAQNSTIQREHCSVAVG